MALIVWTLYAALLLTEKGSSALSIQHCSPGSNYVYEHTTVQLTCGQCRDRIAWYVKGNNDQREKYVGECTKNACKVEDKSVFRLNKNQKNRLDNSILHISNIPRRDQLYIMCKCYNRYRTGYQLKDSASCNLKTVPISIVPASFSVQLSGWKVSGVCTVEWMEGESNPMCKWSLKYKSGARDLPPSQGPVTFVKRGSEYYKRQNCTFEVDMPVDDGDYTYSITVPSHPADRFSKTLRFEQPEVPKHNCPETVLEGSKINCTCYASKMGHPPAQIAWSDSNNNHLAVENIRRERSGTIAVCRLSWGEISKQAAYNVRVMYGPSLINISSLTKATGETVLVCTAIDVYPSAVFFWNITCDNKTNDMNTSTCILFTAREEDDRIVECTAGNKIFENVSLSRMYVVHIESAKQSHNTILISGIAAAVVILSIIGALIFVYIVKPRLVVSKRVTQTPVVRYVAPLGDLYTIAATTIEDNGQTENISLRETFENRLNGAESVGYHLARAETCKANEAMDTLNPIIKPKPSRTGTNYMNVTELSSRSGFCVYHHVPWATKSGSTEPDKSETTAPVMANDDYTELHFQVHRSGHEHQDTYYSHLSFR